MIYIHLLVLYNTTSSNTCHTQASLLNEKHTSPWWWPLTRTTPCRFCVHIGPGLLNNTHRVQACVQRLESSGQLAKIKVPSSIGWLYSTGIHVPQAQLRALAYATITGTPLDPPPAPHWAANPNATLALQLVHDFLIAAQCPSTATVLETECHPLTLTQRSREDTAHALVQTPCSFNHPTQRVLTGPGARCLHPAPPAAPCHATCSRRAEPTAASAQAHPHPCTATATACATQPTAVTSQHRCDEQHVPRFVRICTFLQ